MAPTTFGDYAPKDFDGQFQGSVTARDALQMSLNIPAVMVLDRVGPLAFTLSLQNAGAHLAFPTHDAPSLPVALGGLTTQSNSAWARHHSIVRRRASSIGTSGRQSSSRAARVMSGRRTVGSSTGRGT